MCLLVHTATTAVPTCQLPTMGGALVGTPSPGTCSDAMEEGACWIMTSISIIVAPARVSWRVSWSADSGTSSQLFGCFRSFCSYAGWLLCSQEGSMNSVSISHASDQKEHPRSLWSRRPILAEGGALATRDL